MHLPVMNKNLLTTKITVTLKHLNRSTNIEVEPYKKIKILFEKAKEIFFHLGEIKLLHVNKNLSMYLEIPIAEIFKNKQNIMVTVEPEIINKTNPSNPSNQSVIITTRNDISLPSRRPVGRDPGIPGSHMGS